jgi:hypothetical protein
MNSEWKKCPNGHYYQGAVCPHCRTNGNNEPSSSQSTVVNPFSANENGPTRATDGFGNGTGETKTKMPGGGGPKTTVVEPNGDTIVGGPGSKGNGINPGTRTVFIDEDIEETPNGPVKEKVYRNTRRLVGWLVTYSLDPMGVDFKLYEGRNIIGRDMNCNITINDSTVSATHAVILFRSGKYSISDQQSSHGTFVNGEDIELEPRYLKDGDIIRMGNTVFMIRFALFDENANK